MGSEVLLPGGDRLEQSSILGYPRQRRVLSILLDQSHPMTDHNLSVQVAARETGTAPSDVTEEECRPIRVDLHHRCLPKLEATGWIERHPEGVIATESLSFGEVGVSLPRLLDSDLPFWETIDTLVAHPRRQDLVSIVAGRRHPLTLEGLATELAEHAPTPGITKPHENEHTLLVTLHHVDLPMLAEVGLIGYDPDEKTITRTRSLTTLVNRMDPGNRPAKETEAE